MKRLSNFKKSVQKLSLAKRFAHVINDIIAIGYQQSNQYSSKDEFISHLLNASIGGRWPNQYIDYSKVRISRGELIAPHHMTFKKTDSTVHFSWNKDEKFNNSSPVDRLVILLVNENGDHFANYCLAFRKDEKASMRIPNNFIDAANIWAFYFNPKYAYESRETISDSVYLGCY